MAWAPQTTGVLQQCAEVDCGCIPFFFPAILTEEPRAVTMIALRMRQAGESTKVSERFPGFAPPVVNHLGQPNLGNPGSRHENEQNGAMGTTLNCNSLNQGVAARASAGASADASAFPRARART